MVKGGLTDTREKNTGNNWVTESGICKQPTENVAQIIHPVLDGSSPFLAPDHVATQSRIICQSGRDIFNIFKPCKILRSLTLHVNPRTKESVYLPQASFYPPGSRARKMGGEREKEGTRGGNMEWVEQNYLLLHLSL